MESESNQAERRSEPPAAREETATGDSDAVSSAPPSREHGWARAVGKLRHTQQQLHQLRDKGFVRLQRLIGRASTLLPPTPLGGLCGVFDMLPLTAENMLLGYAQGIYAMDFGGQVRWHCPPERFVIYLRDLRISSNMRRELKRASYNVTFDRAPREVLDECAAERGNGEGTWLSERMKKMYLELFEMGAMHTVEAWKDGALVGGSFGVTIGRVWTSESMFHRAPHAGKVQFAAAAAHLVERGFEVVDGQQYSEHFARFGARDVSIAEYRAALARGLAAPATFQAASAHAPLVAAPEPNGSGSAKNGGRNGKNGSRNGKNGADDAKHRAS